MHGTRSFTSIDYHVRCVYSYNLICKCGVSLHSNCNVHLSTEDRTTATTTTLSCNNIQRQQYDEEKKEFLCVTLNTLLLLYYGSARGSGVISRDKCYTGKCFNTKYKKELKKKLKCIRVLKMKEGIINTKKIKNSFVHKFFFLKERLSPSVRMNE